ncbi:hypothetical protein [Tenacibaculum sp. M341]|uniref:hypothetical protein n=1 Tax=Tenacibaculum sp. M341 TaxID=2530339 RepID=UPI0010450775|nr:hypothetical protein [Tenacibaculum sp. M341]TCI94781.1 hypothetical protein EYW44_00230 [Tenacibaculum sp. M341]
MRRVKLGDVFEIKTSKGSAYIHYVYKDNHLGQLIRVLPDLYSYLPDDLDKLVSGSHRFVVFFPLSAANKKQQVKFVGNHLLDNYEKPKQMRTEHYIAGEFLGWDIIDTDTWKRKFVKKLSNKQRKLSPWGIWNDTLLVERLEEGWSLDNWCSVR